MTKTYLITGANRGIGLELAKQLKAKGHTVIGTTRNLDDAAELSKTADRVLTLDVTDDTSTQSFARDLASTPIDVLINNAGMAPDDAGIEKLDLEKVRRAFEVNSIAALRVTRSVLKNLRAGKAKVVVGVSSILGSIERTPDTGGGQYAYRASKAALNMLMRTLAGELKDEGFTCFALHPGWVRTRMGGENAPLSVEDSARGIVDVVDNAGADAHGAFIDHRGKRLPW